DVVFSSNVLEHIAHVERFQREMQRVLRPGGRAIHIVPSACWRLWTSVAHYPFLVKYLLKRVRGLASPARELAHGGHSAVRGSFGDRLYRALVSPRHGELGGPLSELYYFSRMRWETLFERSGWVIRDRTSNHLIYTGYSLLGSALSLDVRARLSRVLGSACHV